MRVPQKPAWTRWDHNGHYHSALLAEVPAGCRNALDVGCGGGTFVGKVASRSHHVVGIDRDAAIIDLARSSVTAPNIEFRCEDLFDASLENGSFDFVSCIATLHHMPLAPALLRMKELQAPGGVLAVVGLHRHRSLLDLAHYAAVLPVDLAMGIALSRSRPQLTPGLRMLPPSETLRQIRAAAADLLPGVVVRRRMYTRYTLVYRAPA